MTSRYKIGVTLVGITPLNALPTPLPDPRSPFTDAALQKTMHSGKVLDVGAPAAEWAWDILSRAQRDQLRAIIPARSAWVYIATRSNDNADLVKTFYGLAVWPDESQMEVVTGHRLNFSIQFKHLQEVA